MNLRELRTPQPLSEVDFAAIRARVRAEIARRDERPWLAMLLRLAFACAAVALFVPITRERVPEVPVIAARPLPAARPAGVQTAHAVADRSEARRMTPARRRPRKRTLQPPPPQLTRIEIHTPDPTIRIIWLTPKENS